MTNVLVFSNDQVGAVMAGPGIRSYELARALSGDFPVTLAAPGGAGAAPHGVANVDTAGLEPDQLADLFGDYDVVVTQFLPLQTARSLTRRRTRVIYDLYIPFVERLGFLETDLDPSRAAPEESAEPLFAAYSRLVQRYAISTGSGFICASERQRDLWLGMLAAAGRIDLDTYRRDPTLRTLIDVVPFGLPVDAPESVAAPDLPEGIAPTDRLLLWAGGVWNWLDPLTPIRAIATIAERRNDVKLLFLGLRRPVHAGQSVRAEQAVALAEELGVLDSAVFFNRDWIPYADRWAFLRAADAGVSAHFDSLETRYTFRTRLLDHFWAGLPTIATGGDVLGDLIQARRLGYVVRVEDVAGWVRAIDRLLEDERELAEMRRRIAETRQEFEWPRVVEPLRRLVAATRAPACPGGAAIAAEEFMLRLQIAVALGGPRAAAARQARKLRALARRG